MKAVSNITNTPISSVQYTAAARSVQSNRHANTSFGIKPIEINPKGKPAKLINNLGLNFSSAMQRFVTGVTAIFTQPFFDLNNKNVDEETRKTSCARTLGKIIAGTLTGVTIRWACVKATENFTRNENTENFLRENPKASLAKKALANKDILPKHQLLLPESLKHASYREIKNYRAAFGTLAAVIIMIATNFLIDAPLTTYFTNKFVKNLKDTKSAENNIAEGGNK